MKVKLQSAEIMAECCGMGLTKAMIRLWRFRLLHIERRSHHEGTQSTDTSDVGDNRSEYAGPMHTFRAWA